MCLHLNHVTPQHKVIGDTGASSNAIFSIHYSQIENKVQRENMLKLYFSLFEQTSPLHWG